MNELNLVDELYEEPAPPSGRTVAAARRRMTQDVPKPRRVWRPTFRLGLVVAGTAAAVTTATVVVGALGDPAPERPSQVPTRHLSARQVLLAAADSAAREPVGRHWRRHFVQESVTYLVDSGEDDYLVNRGVQWDEWTSRDPNGTSSTFSRSLGPQPTTEADRAAWRRAGSPRVWRVRTTDDPREITLTMKGPGRWTTHGTAPQDGQDCPPTTSCVRDWRRRDGIAARPGGLERLLFPEREKRGARAMEARSAAAELMTAAEFLTLPASPGTREAAFRLLADRPGIRTADRVTDMRGRTGVGLVARGTTLGGGSGVFDYQLILDPRTYRVLGTQYVVVSQGTRFPGVPVGTVVERRAVLDLGWTNEAPHHE